MTVLAYWQAGIDFNTLWTQLPIVAICLAIVWYFDTKNEKKDERFMKFVREMQEDWQEHMDKQSAKNEDMMKDFKDVIAKHTDTLNQSIQAKTQLVGLIERELIARKQSGD